MLQDIVERKIRQQSARGGPEGPGPMAGVVRGSAPLPKKIFQLYLVGIRYAISLPILSKTAYRRPTNTKLLRKKTKTKHG